MPDEISATDPAASPDAVLDALAEQAEALRRAGRADEAELLLAFRRLHARRLGATGAGEG